VRHKQYNGQGILMSVQGAKGKRWW